MHVRTNAHTHMHFDKTIELVVLCFYNLYYMYISVYNFVFSVLLNKNNFLTKSSSANEG